MIFSAQAGGVVMNIFEALKKCFLNYANFHGRARRSEYWYFCLFNLVVMIILMKVSAALGSKIFLNLWLLAMVCPGLAVSWRRLHDIGKSGKYWLVNFIPGIGGIIFTVWMLQSGEVGPNKYGPDPQDENIIG